MILPFVLLRALPLACMKYTARDESQVANIERGKAIFVTRLLSRAVYFHTNKVAMLFVFYTNLIHLLNKQTVSFIKCVNRTTVL